MGGSKTGKRENWVKWYNKIRKLKENSCFFYKNNGSNIDGSVDNNNNVIYSYSSKSQSVEGYLNGGGKGERGLSSSPLQETSFQLAYDSLHPPPNKVEGYLNGGGKGANEEGERGLSSSPLQETSFQLAYDSLHPPPNKKQIEVRIKMVRWLKRFFEDECMWKNNYLLFFFFFLVFSSLFKNDYLLGFFFSF
jgi:hypothetical protein